MRPAWVVLALTVAAAPVPSRSDAATWGDVFAADTDTMVFFGTRGALLRAPFSLSAPETLWRPPPGQSLVRVRVSPDGRRVAWLARGHDRDTTRLWVSGAGSGGPRVRYFALLPGPYGRVHAEPDAPTLDDVGSRGGRLIRAGSAMRRQPSNTLEWTPDSRTVVFGYDGGIAAVPVDGGTGFGVRGALAVELTALEPAPIYLVDAIVLPGQAAGSAAGGGVLPVETVSPLGEGQPISHALELEYPEVLMSQGASSGGYLLYPAGRSWRVFAASGLTPARSRAASPRTVWWALGNTIRAIHVHDPNPTEEVRAPETVSWLGYDAARGDLLWAAGREVARRPEEGGRAAVVLRTASPVRAALPAARSRRIGFVAGDSLVVWDQDDGSVRRVALCGLTPTALFEDSDGGMLVATRAGRPTRRFGVRVSPGLARVDVAAGRLVPLAVPRVAGGILTPVSRGARILLCNPGSRAPASLHVLDVRTGRWDRVANPGITGWEPLEPR